MRKSKTGKKMDSATAPYIQQLQQHIAPVLDGIPYQIYLFGSRANNTAHAGSDIDLAILAEQDLRLPLSQARFALENSTIPYKIDLVELQRTSPDFQQQVLREGQLLWKTN
jgi:uncharacterized protein